MISVAAIKDEQYNRTIVSISYDKDIEDNYVILEYYDEVLKKWIPYDNKNGIVELFK